MLKQLNLFSLILTGLIIVRCSNETADNANESDSGTTYQACCNISLLSDEKSDKMCRQSTQLSTSKVSTFQEQCENMNTGSVQTEFLNSKLCEVSVAKAQCTYLQDAITWVVYYYQSDSTSDDRKKDCSEQSGSYEEYS